MLTHSLTPVEKTILMWLWRGKMPTQNLLRLFLLLMLVMRIVLATVCCRFRSWGSVIKHNFFLYIEHKVCQDFEEKVQARFEAGVDVWLGLRNWILVKILKLGLVEMLMFGCNLNCKLWTQPSGPLCLWKCFVNSYRQKLSELDQVNSANLLLMIRSLV